MDRFARLHPVVHFVFFLFTFVFVLSVNNPFFSVISLVGALLYSLLREGSRVLSSIKLSVVLLLTVSLFNFFFAHYGEDVLFTVGDTEFTLEALFYGFNQGMVLCSVMLWFGALSQIADSERVVYFLRWAPGTALVFSMVLGFIPRFRKKAEDIRNARLALNGGCRDSSLKGRLNEGVTILSALVTYSLESSVLTARSMTARGYNPSAQPPGRYLFTFVDGVIILLMLVTSIIIFIEKAMGNLVFVFEPEIYAESVSSIAVAAFVMLQALPFFVDITEDLQWRISASRN
ncbi:MAG: energy-coupling factor transporter transmembrane component T [Eubacterium sp.]